MRAIRGPLTAATALLVGTGMAACSSTGTTQAAGTPRATVSASPSPSPSPSSSPSASPSRSPSPLGSNCPPPAGTEIIQADGTTKVDGQFAVTGYVQSLECGPNVPDDVLYRNTGSHQAFVLTAGVKVLLFSQASPQGVPATLAELEAALQQDFGRATPLVGIPSGIGLESNLFALTLGAGGRITGITALYHP